MGDTDFLTRMSEQGAESATAKYAGWTWQDLFRMQHAVPEGPVPAGGWTHEALQAAKANGAKIPWWKTGWAEFPRYLAFGDPLTAVDQMRGRHVDPYSGRNIGALEGTFLPGGTVSGRVMSGVMNYGLPLGLTAYQYFKTPEAERKYHRGETWGSMAGNVIGGTIGSRLGWLGGSLLGGLGGRIGGAIGHSFDPDPSKRYGVKPLPALSPGLQQLQRTAPLVGGALANQAGGPSTSGT